MSSSTSTAASQFVRPHDAGSHTVEGNKAGSRAAALERQRQRAAEDFERRKRELAAQRNKTALTFQPSASTATTTTATTTITTPQEDIDAETTTHTAAHFQSSSRAKSSVEESFRAKTVGLVSAEDFARAQKEALQQEQLIEEEEEYPQVPLQKEKPREDKKTRKKRQREKKKLMAVLSFGNELEEEEGQEDEDAQQQQQSSSVTKRTKTSLKCPSVDTSFLPDQQRDADERAERIRLAREWKQAQKEQRESLLEVTYSYWDGSGHRKTITIKQGNTIGEFLQKVLDDLVPQFRQLSSCTSDDLLYVKEDIILPSDITFYDLIATKARGKSGPLFAFDVHDDVRVGPLDVRIEKDDSHPGKVVERRWYERNKHIFPASRWEFYDPSKDYGQYTIGGKIVQPSKRK